MTLLHLSKLIIVPLLQDDQVMAINAILLLQVTPLPLVRDLLLDHVNQLELLEDVNSMDQTPSILLLSVFDFHRGALLSLLLVAYLQGMLNHRGIPHILDLQRLTKGRHRHQSK